MRDITNKTYLEKATLFWMYASKNREDFFWNKKEQHSNHCYVIWEKATFAEQFLR